MHTNINEISKLSGEDATLKGWIYNLRSSGSIVFLQFRDGTGTIQVVAIKNDLNEEIFKLVQTLNVESSVEVTGLVKKDERAPSGYEIELKEIKVLNLAPDDYPIAKRQKGEEHGVEFLLDHRHLDLRSANMIAIQRIRNEIIFATYEFLYKEKFVKIDAPIFTPTSCEDTTELFKVPYTPAWEEGATDGPFVYLTQSGQLYIESAIFAHGKVFDFGPVFRAEKSKTRRHLIEFWMMDAEMAFFDHEANMEFQERLIERIVTKVLLNCKKDLEVLGRDITKLEKIKTPFERMTHLEAINKIKEMGVEIGERDDLGADEEAKISNLFEKPVFIEKYPKEIKAFYMKRDPSDPTRVLNNDLFAPEGYGEIIGGSQRMDDYDELEKIIIGSGFNLEDYKWYLDLRKYGSVEHSGFGFGLERLVSWICGIKHIRNSIPFPRMINRIRP